MSSYNQIFDKISCKSGKKKPRAAENFWENGKNLDKIFKIDSPPSKIEPPPLRAQPPPKTKILASPPPQANFQKKARGLH